MTKQSLSPADIDAVFASGVDFFDPKEWTPNSPAKKISGATRRRISRANFGASERLEPRQYLSGVAAEVSIENDRTTAATALEQAEQHLVDATAAVLRDTSSLAAAENALNMAQAQLIQAQQAPAESIAVTQAIRATATGAQEYASPDYAEGHNSQSGRQLGWMIFGQQYHAPTGRFYTWRSGLTFDTAGLPDDAVITDAKLKIVPYDKNDVSNRKPQAILVPLSSGSTALGSLGYDAVTLNRVNVLTLNNAGKLAINKTGPTAFALRTDQEIAGEPPRTDGNNLYFFQVRGKDSPDEQPILEVTYTATTRSGVTTAELSLKNAQDAVNAANATFTASQIAQAAARNVRDAAKQSVDALSARTPALDTEIRNQWINELTTALTETFAAEQALETQQVKYPKLYVTADTSTNDRIVFNVRYRTPDPNTEIVGRVFQNGTFVDFTSTSAVSEHGIADAIWRPSYNRGNGQVFFIMRNRTTGQVLDQVSFFCPDNREARLETPQLPFEQEEQGRLSENPITPDLKVVGMQGPNVLVAYQTPKDTAQVHIDGGGMLSWQTITQAGGTNFSLGRVTFNVARPAGTYNLILTDAHGMVQKSVPASWDGTSLHLINSGDQWQGNSALIQNNQTATDFRNIGLLPNIDIDDPVVRNIQQSNLYIATGTLPANLNFYYPTDRIMSLYNSMSPRPALDTLTNNFQVYGQAVGDIVKAALEVFIGIEHGRNEVELRQQLQNVINGNANKPAVQWLRQDGVGVNFPDLGASLEIGKILFRQEWEHLMQIRLDVAAQRDWQVQQREGGLRETAAGQWVVASGMPSPELATMTRSQINTATKVRLVLEHSPNQVIARINGQHKNEVAILSARTPIAEQQNAVRTFAMGVVDETLRAPNSEYDLSTLSFNDREFPINLVPNGTATVTFRLDRPTMMNAWIEPGKDGSIQGSSITYPTLAPNLSLTLVGGPNNISYLSDKQNGSAETVSSVLPAGQYTILIADHTNYPSPVGFGPTDLSHVQLPVITLHTSPREYNTTRIEGRVSIEGNMDSMPVSMSVAEFKPDGQRKVFGVDAINTLDPNKPVCIIVHGMNSNEGATPINELAKALKTSVGTSMQIVTVDWNKAAKDPLFIGRDARWTEVIGQWTARQLIAAGFEPLLINGAGHSHGTFVLWAMAKEIMKLTDGKQMNALVALDAAGNVPSISDFDHTKVDFAAVSRNALAFESAFGTDSDRLAGTADTAFHINSPSTSSPITEHQLGLTTFVSIVNHERTTPGQFSEYFSLQQIMVPAENRVQPYAKNKYNGVFEGIIDIGVTPIEKSDGTYYQANPSDLYFKRVGDEVEKAVLFNALP